MRCMRSCLLDLVLGEEEVSWLVDGGVGRLVVVRVRCCRMGSCPSLPSFTSVGSDCSISQKVSKLYSLVLGRVLCSNRDMLAQTFQVLLQLLWKASPLPNLLLIWLMSVIHLSSVMASNQSVHPCYRFTSGQDSFSCSPMNVYLWDQTRAGLKQTCSKPMCGFWAHTWTVSPYRSTQIVPHYLQTLI